MLHVTELEYLAGHKIFVSFDDGTSGTVDLSGKLNGPVFEPLLEVEYFSQVSLDRELGTIVWPNGADLAPEFLKDLLHDRSTGARSA